MSNPQCHQDGYIPVTTRTQPQPVNQGVFPSPWSRMCDRMNTMQSDMERLTNDLRRDFADFPSSIAGHPFDSWGRSLQQPYYAVLEHVPEQNPASLSAFPRQDPTGPEPSIAHHNRHHETQQHNPPRWGSWWSPWGSDWSPFRSFLDDFVGGRRNRWWSSPSPFPPEPLEENMIVPAVYTPSLVSNRMGRMFDGFSRGIAPGGACFPRVDIRHTNDKTIVHADLPGMTSDDVNVSISGNRMNISGEKNSDETDRGSNYFMQERCESRFNRSFALPPNITEKDITANLNNGVLEVEIDRSRENKALTSGVNIPITQSSSPSSSSTRA